MKLLYIAPYSSADFRFKYADMHTPGIGGLRKVEQIARALTQSGHKILVLSSAMLSISKLSWRQEVHEVVYLENGISFNVVYPSALMLRPFGGFINCLRSRRIIRKTLEQFKPDAAIVYNTYLFESLAVNELLRIRPIPICLEIEDLPLARRRGLFNLKPLMDQLCWSGMLRKASSFLAVNQDIYDMLPESKRKILMPGIIDQQLLLESMTRSRPFTNRCRQLGYFGALTQEKGVKVLLELVPKLEAPWKLVVTGSGPLSKDFEQLANRFPERFQFFGNVTQSTLYQTMCKCDCVVIPQEQITDNGKGVFPFKTFEYLIAGAHIISTPLASQGSLDLTFIQRWDGNVNSLLTCLSTAESDYYSENESRKSACEFVIEKYISTNVAQILTEVIS